MNSMTLAIPFGGCDETGPLTYMNIFEYGARQQVAAGQRCA